jgi:hypothetical protein
MMLGRGIDHMQRQPSIRLHEAYVSDARCHTSRRGGRRLKRSGDLAIVSSHRGSNWGYEITASYVRFARRLIDAAALRWIKLLFHGLPVMDVQLAAQSKARDARLEESRHDRGGTPRGIRDPGQCFSTRPTTWDSVVKKFQGLAAPHVDERLRRLGAMGAARTRHARL